jgi:Rha family phage regulatory protein
MAIIDGCVTTTSLAVAEMFGKEHKNVLRNIGALVSPDSGLSQEFNELNFELVEYADAKNEKRPMYRLSKDGFVILAMGFTGATAMRFKEAYINAFNGMERALLKLAQGLIDRQWCRFYVFEKVLKARIAQVLQETSRLLPSDLATVEHDQVAGRLH